MRRSDALAYMPGKQNVMAITTLCFRRIASAPLHYAVSCRNNWIPELSDYVVDHIWAMQRSVRPKRKSKGRWMLRGAVMNLSLRKPLAYLGAGFFQLVILDNLTFYVGAVVGQQWCQNTVNFSFPNSPPIWYNVLQ